MMMNMNNTHRILENDMRRIVFEDINRDFGWGKYGEFKVMIHKATGRINATKLCALGNRRMCKWNELKSSRDLIDTFRQAYPNRGEPIQIISTEVDNETRGTYVDPLLVPHIASWVSAEFAFYVSEIVNNHLIHEAVREHKKLLGEKEETIVNLQRYIVDFRAETKEALESLGVQLGVANENIIDISTTLGGVCDRSVPVDRIPQRHREFMYIFMFSSPDEDGMMYRAINCQQANLTSQLKAFGLSGSQLVYQSPIHPNPVEEWTKFRRVMARENLAEFRHRRFKLNCDWTHALTILNEIYNQRREPFKESIRKLYERCNNQTIGIDIEEERREEGREEGEGKEDRQEERREEDQRPTNLTFEDLMMMTKPQLKEIAKETGKKGYSTLNKRPLVEWILSQ